MTMSLKCPHCGQAGRIRDELVGKQVRCRKCEKFFLATGPIEPRTPEPAEPIRTAEEAAAVSAEATGDADESAPKAPDKRRRRLFRLMPAVAVIGALVLGIAYTRRVQAWSVVLPKVASEIDTDIALYTDQDIPQLTANFARVDEQLFVLFALEDMARKIPTATGKLDHAGLPAPVVVAIRLNELSSNLAQQRRGYDTLRRHVQDREDPDFLEIFGIYGQVLDLMDEATGRFRQRMKGHLHALENYNGGIWAKALTSGMAYGLRSVAQGEDGETAWTRGVMGGFASIIEDRPEAIKVQAAFRETLMAALREFDQTFKSQIDGAIGKFRDKIDKSKWGKGTDFAFKSSVQRPMRNPFQVVVRAQSALGERQPQLTTEQLIVLAQICRETVKAVPPGPAYDLYRAQFLSTAGMLADKAAAKDLGATGLPESENDAPKGGRLSEELWAQYVEVEPYDTSYTDDVARAHFMSHAYAGHLDDAYEIIAARALEAMNLRPRDRTRDTAAKLHLSASNRPDFWYDCARVCSMTGHNRTAIECLTRAVKVGFQSGASAKFNPDFRNVREDRVTGDLFKKLFH
jgi:hypothetical protein